VNESAKVVLGRVPINAPYPILGIRQAQTITRKKTAITGAPDFRRPIWIVGSVTIYL
jgi:hypothetical protein